MTSRNFVHNNQGEYRVVRGWVEYGDNVTLYGNHGLMVSVKDDIDDWTDPDEVEARLQRPFDKKGLPLIDGPADWLDD